MSNNNNSNIQLDAAEGIPPPAVAPTAVDDDVTGLMKGDDNGFVEIEIPVALANNINTTSTTSPSIKRNNNNNNNNNIGGGGTMELEGTTTAASNVCPPEVKWEPDHRSYHDKMWGILYVLSFLAFLVTGTFLVVNAHPRYEWISLDEIAASNSNNNTTMTASLLEYYFGNVGDDDYDSSSIRVVSKHFYNDVQKCCQSTNNQNNNNGLYRFDLCSELDVDAALAFQSSWFGGGGGIVFDDDDDMTLVDDFQQEDDDDSNGGANEEQQKGPTSKYQQGDGMFDAFLEAPEIIITLTIVALFLAVMWVVLLRFFAVPIVYLTEGLKVGFFLYLAINSLVEGMVMAFVISLICAMGIVAWDVYAFNKLKFAGQMLSQAAKAFKHCTSMFIAFLPILILYAGNAGLFVLFFARSFEVVEVQAVADGTRCEYVSPSYATPIVFYLSLAYLWSILLFNAMRLSIISNVVGSWHFHPHHQPSIGRAIKNTCTTSLGTLSVASLISTVAERINRLFLKEKLLMNCFNPIFWVLMPLYCVFGQCLRMLIRMLTKFSIILHVFTGKSWMGSARKSFSILKRHFKGSFVTEYASSSVLALGSYVFSIAIYFIAWKWLDREFKTDTFVGVNDNTLLVVGWLFFALFNIWYPVLGLYLMILLNRWLSQSEFADPSIWVTPFAATFIGCISMMFFTYLAGTFLDTVDVLFLCFAIDRDNDAIKTGDEFAKLVFEGVPNVLADPDWEGTETEKGNHDDEESPNPVVVPAQP